MTEKWRSTKIDYGKGVSDCERSETVELEPVLEMDNSTFPSYRNMAFADVQSACMAICRLAYFVQ